MNCLPQYLTEDENKMSECVGKNSCWFDTNLSVVTPCWAAHLIYWHLFGENASHNFEGCEW